MKIKRKYFVFVHGCVLFSQPFLIEYQRSLLVKNVQVEYCHIEENSKCMRFWIFFFLFQFNLFLSFGLNWKKSIEIKPDPAKSFHINNVCYNHIFPIWLNYIVWFVVFDFLIKVKNWEKWTFVITNTKKRVSPKKAWKKVF